MGERKGLRQVRGPLQLIVGPGSGIAGLPTAELACGHEVADLRRNAELPLGRRRMRCRHCRAEAAG